MRTILTALTVASMFAACKSNIKTDKDLVGTGSYVETVDSSQVKKLPDGTQRVTVVEKRNADGSSTITTTTDVNTKKTPAARTSTVSSPSEVSSAPVASTVPVAAPAKTGWSSRAKGAVIGGVGGAATGVIISKDKVKGGILGGAIGAGGGYIIGNEIDRKKAKQ